jgi:hemolysin activation/secretion protein
MHVALRGKPYPTVVAIVAVECRRSSRVGAMREGATRSHGASVWRRIRKRSGTELLQFPLIYNATVTDIYGQTVFENDLTYSPGNLTSRNTDEAIQQLVPFAKANYLYDRFSVTRATFLPYDLTWIARGTVQGTTVNLPDSEQLGGGGIGSVRGYDPETALGSKGVLFSQELRLPAFSPLRAIGTNIGVADQMQFGVFWDYASLSQSTPLPDLPRNVTLASVGFNVHYNLERYLDVEFELGSQLRRAPNAVDHGTLAAIVTTVSF